MSTAIDAIDAANALDPNQIEIAGGALAKELIHARSASQWLHRLAPDASPALQIAVRAHHLERWLRPRDAYEKGRTGYLRWRRDAQRFHAERMREIVARAGGPDAVVDHAAKLIQKARPLDETHRAEARAFEDALCLVFVEHQLADFANSVSSDKLRSILSKTLPKMSPEAVALAAELPVVPEHRALLHELAAQISALETP
jgi:hypothetical protein